MLKLSFKNLFANKIRFFLTGFAVVLGVAFVVAAFVLSDTLDEAFDEISASIAESIDVKVVGAGAFGSTAPVPVSLLDDIRAQPNVAAAMAVVDGAPGVTATTADGDAVGLGSFGPPLIGITVDPNPENQVSNFTLLEGSWAGDGEIAVDIDTADRDDIAIGDTLSVAGTAGQFPLTVSGIVRFGKDNGAGAQYLVFSPEVGQQLEGLPSDQLGAIDVAARDGVSEDQLKGEIEAVLSDEYQVRTGEEVREEFEEQFGQFVDILRGVFLGFAVVSLFVSSFLINNTFSIVIGQRIRELGLLRAVGATGRQVALAVVVEAILIGFVASIIGILAGLGLAAILKAFLDAAGFLPEGSIRLLPRTALVAIAVGMIVTFVASIVPARKAVRIPPIAALRDGVSLDSSGVAIRTAFGILTALLAGILLFAGMTSDASGVAAKLVPLGIGAVLAFLAVTILSPLFAGPVVQLLGAPLRAIGIPGRLAQQNAARSPGRTSSTASALMIGLSLVTLASVVGASIKQTLNETLDTSVEADFFVTAGFQPFSQVVGNELDALPEIESVTRFRASQQLQKILVNGEGKTALGASGDSLTEALDPGFISGSAEGLSDNGILVYREPAEDMGLSIGDKLNVVLPLGVFQEVTVVGIYDDSFLLGNWVIDLSLFERGFAPGDQKDQFVALTVADTTGEAGVIDDADIEAAETAMKPIEDDFPNVDVQDLTEFKASQAQQLDGFLTAINVFLALAVIIAVLGIANTLALSVFERTREIGLLRAVGMVRGQARTMIAGEAVVVSLFGTVLGAGLGLILGVGLTRALPDSIVQTTSVPWGTIVALFIMALIAGLIAAIFPARRAAKLNVLDAISGV